MAKWSGLIGFEVSSETDPGVWVEHIESRRYYGDFMQNSNRIQASGNINDNVKLSNKISVIADPYAKNNFQSIRYVTYMGNKWKVSDIIVQYPRLILSLGDVYTG